MKLIKYTLLTLLLSICSYGEDKIESLWDNQPLGINDTSLSQNISKYQFQDMNNVFTDNNNGVEVCNGVYKIWQTTGNVRMLKEYTKTDGSRYFIFVASNALNVANTAGAYTTLITTISLTSKVWGVQYNNRIYIGDSSGESWYFDGTNLVQSTYVPTGQYAISAYGILFIANQTNNQSKVSYSKIDNFYEFDSLFYFLISKDDGDEITGMFLFKGDVYITKRHSIHKLINIDDNTNIGDSWITLSKEVGCVSNKTIQELNNNMYWLSEDGVIEFDGTSFNILSSDIKNTISNISELKSGIQYDTLTSSADFANGTFSTGISTYSGNSVMIVTTGDAVNQQNVLSNASAGASASDIAWQTFVSSVAGYISQVQVQGALLDAAHPQNVLISIRGGDLSVGCTETVYISAPGTQLATVYFDPLVKISSGTEYQLHVEFYYWSIQNGGSVYNRGLAHYSNSDHSTEDFWFKISMIESTKTYTSPIRNMSAGDKTWLQWQKFSYSVSNDNDTQYFIRTSSNSENISGYPWTSIRNDTVINSTVGAFYQYYMIINSSNTSYSFNESNISYYASNSLQTLSSQVDIKNMRYLLGYTELPETSPNTILIWQIRNKSFTKIRTLNQLSMGYYKYDLYLGNTSGGINRYSSDYTDFNGTSINPWIKTPDFDFGGRIIDKTQTELWLSHEPSTVYPFSTIEFYVNKSTYSLLTATVSLTADSYFPNNTIINKFYKSVGRFKTISFKISNFFKFNGLDFIYSLGTRR